MPEPGEHREPSPRLRLFFALRLPDSVKIAIATAQAELRLVLGGHARWTTSDQMHLTLKFLGSVNCSDVAALLAATEQALGAFTPLELCAAGLGAFPGSRRPRILWAGVQDKVGALIRLQRALEDAVQPFTHEPRTDEFVGHVTLARVKEVPPAKRNPLAALLSKGSRTQFGSWRSDRVVLFRSQLSPSGARYFVEAELVLRGPGDFT